jgi:hypothetical protein
LASRGKEKGKKPKRSQAWCFTSVIPALNRLRQEDHQFNASLVYKIETTSQKTTKIKEDTKISSL